ncbi:MAG: SDR family oxidoreductase [Candidatus Hydrogenedentes bacterium]|nr:SDR family oxidoreductase [Candidatus Hydrogenedentota bacterium]
MTQIAKKTVLITGGAQGLGRLLAERCVQHGAAKVILWDINEETLQETAQALGGQGTTIESAQVNVQDSAQIAAAVAKALETQAVDILINNAGIVVGKPLSEHSHDDINRTIGVNVLGVMHTTRAFLPAIQAHGGHIVNIASASGYLPLPNLTTYAASKWACLGFSESLRVELRDIPDVHITTVCPSYINTGMFDGVTAPIATPILDPDYVTDKIIAAIQANKAVLRMPRIVNLVPLCYTLLPQRLFDLVCGRWLGIYRAMDLFKGHGKK